MHTVTLEFETTESVRRALEEALQSTAIPAPPDTHPPAGTTCRLTISCGPHALELFALATPTAFRLTDEPGDLRFAVERFLAELPPDAPEPAPAEPNEADEPAEEPTVSEEPLDEEALGGIQREVGSRDPLIAELKRIQKLQIPQKIKLAEDGDLSQRTLLFRMYGKLVFDGLLRNSRITEMEVAKIAKLGTLPVPLLQSIARRSDWLRSERVRNALLSNPRSPQAVLQKIAAMLSKNEVRQLLQRRDFTPAAQAAIKDRAHKLLG